MVDERAALLGKAGSIARERGCAAGDRVLLSRGTSPTSPTWTCSARRHRRGRRCPRPPAARRAPTARDLAGAGVHPHRVRRRLDHDPHRRARRHRRHAVPRRLRDQRAVARGPWHPPRRAPAGGGPPRRGRHAAGGPGGHPRRDRPRRGQRPRARGVLDPRRDRPHRPRHPAPPAAGGPAAAGLEADGEALDPDTALARELQAVLADVRAAVEDWPRDAGHGPGPSPTTSRPCPTGCPRARSTPPTRPRRPGCCAGSPRSTSRSSATASTPCARATTPPTRRCWSRCPAPGLGIVRDAGSSPTVNRLSPDVTAHARRHDVLVLTKANSRATVHRVDLPGLRGRQGLRRLRARWSGSGASSAC